MPYDDKSENPEHITFNVVPDSEYPSDHLALGCTL